ncbi:MAG: hypothetical protein FD174_3008 [Geobacteraceae bacterium]|nr:MAG: hypothetical protein FD174_3008 [Geobacteraceae bacterium]
MRKRYELTAVIEREGDGYVALCPELDIASQGGTVEEARNNLQEALELFFETADPSEVEGTFHPRSSHPSVVKKTKRFLKLGCTQINADKIETF